MISKSMTINIQKGLEARPVALLVQVASQYESSIYVEIQEKKVNAKSIMGMMSLGLAEGEQITIIANGPDEEEAVNAIDKYISKQQ
ncbi:HPr family phosphocarrier protein [Frisingicoccus sp.]|uniref:HPr family phosphocarrier protein n=1 Tax=Frisingicoccus sp. TaxID=1918627 RepID=UPI0025B7BECE|nr:HPr family phosphocarrier protein [Frisingicoccus sp.]MDD6232191.1 HPr family phosphocarrier protein [Frisingicoccus sp.]MDY4835110.1 HPr family phosphocarrier protein [Frisingicoccus sp.]MDY4923175.1 HPr family phosphocarrier protein [Frisingicoccus sp.]